MQTLRERAESWLRATLGETASFREGQWEAIEALVHKRQKVLVVQRTGWGKSLVYFLATRLLRAQGQGVTILVSPLLSLMRNQIESANLWGIKAATLNSENSDDHARIEQALLNGEIDLLLISPERLANDRFRTQVWSKLKHQIGMLVVDEAHCISDWGHDFRPNYRRIMGLLGEIPSDTPIIGTTATANDRVVMDVAEILGTDIHVLRGALTRDSLSLYVYPEPLDSATRLTLLSHLLKSIVGSGIIYCTTTRDCVIVAEWLQQQGFNVKPYFSGVEAVSNESRVSLEQQLMQNQVKALVSSVALGMGFDKSDLYFVIHYQLPGNIIGYYQQIGRAGRGIDNAYIVLMHGPGDEDIQRYFIDSAFPEPEQVQAVIAALRHEPKSRNMLQQDVNVRFSVLEKILTHLEVEHILEKRGSHYVLLQTDGQPDYARWAAVTEMRYAELRHMQDYMRTSECLMKYIGDVLDDPKPKQCGRCKNCTGVESKFQPNSQQVLAAQTYLRDGKPLLFQPRKRWVKGLPNIAKTTDILVNQTGIAACMYFDTVYGAQVRDVRDNNNRHFSDDLVEMCARVLRQHLETLTLPPDCVVAVPSLRRPMLVPDFASRLANHIGLPVIPALEHHVQHAPQIEMHNSYQQAYNLWGKFRVHNEVNGRVVLLVDDVVDSGWTMAVLGDLLQRQGAKAVHPFAIATTNAFV